MKRIWKHLGSRRRQVAAHPFFVWFKNDGIPAERRFVFAPLMIDFIMGFADMNKWFLSYDEPQNELERAINQHTEEDRTHASLFYDNWYTLSLGENFDFTPGKSLFWLFLARDAHIVRRFGMDILDIAVKHPEPLVRFSMMEAIELCGDVFFAATAPVAQALAKQTGRDQLYFGQFHRARETGHLHADETAFVRAQCTFEQHASAMRSVDRVFDHFVTLLDRLLTFAHGASTNPVSTFAEIDAEYAAVLVPPAADELTQPQRSHEKLPCHPSQRRPLALLEGRAARLREHPFMRWLSETEGDELQKLQGFAALWGIDCTGFKDFQDLVLRYATPSSEYEEAINRWTEQLGRQSSLYLQDWSALSLDRALGWDMGESVGFYFLSEQTERHRLAMAKVKKLAFKHTRPALRYWLMLAIERSKDILFEGTRPLANVLEVQRGITLNYWTQRHEQFDPTFQQREQLLLGVELSTQDNGHIAAMINTVFDNMEELFTLSQQEATLGRFLRTPASLPPSRDSAIVLRGRAETLIPGENDEDERKAG